MLVDLVGKPNNTTGQGTQASSTSDVKGIDTLVATLRDVVKLSQDDLDLFLITLVPYLNGRITSVLAKALSAEELSALDIEAAKRGFDDLQVAQMYQVAYNKKTGKQLEEAIDEIFAKINQAIIDTKAEMEKLIADIKNLPSEQQQQKLAAMWKPLQS